MENRYQLYGVLGSPYAAKLRALLRYRQIPFDWVPAGFDWAPSYYRVRPELSGIEPRIIPTLRFPDGSFHVDSTVIAYELEQLHSKRSIIPGDAGLAFLSDLIDDMGDEWVLKIAFHYRWGNEEDRNYTNRLILGELLGGGVPQKTIVAAANEFRDRQMSRMPLVGCTPLNAPLIQKTYDIILDAIASLRERSAFLFGSRPSLGDFGLFGAMFTCRNDPTPGGIMRRSSPGTLDWLYALDEGSGIEGDWVDPAAIDEGVKQLLRLAGDVYLPFLQANETAVEYQASVVEMEALGFPFRQAPFKYQAKCFRVLRDKFRKLEGAARARTVSILEETGCLKAFVG
ncbi:glutathione S-transferase N-terminal domain-containing protein [Bradyrhizobium sp. 33ap4]|uniref:glutathione S-transferase N-terminal domain-containing protein n=1 Tax=Bradyrhizobium sp. 33ap4 TaxID=3061630 RepID=UPI00292DB09F|nr:glutathione S-transferase N-terminal domain-containing protein [Bradyrhizobium sp. 33ap4]